MANGIWLYYTKKGNLAKIQHGQVIRQGGGFKLIFAFEDKSLILNRILTVAFKKPGGETTPFYPVAEKITEDNLENYREKFSKIKSTEMTYGLQDGVEYYALNFNAPSVGITDKYGVLTVITKVTEIVGDIDYIDEDKDGTFDNQEKDDIVYFQGSAQLYIEPTYGKPTESSNISMTQYEALINYLNTEIAKKVAIEQGIAKELTLEGDIKANTIPETFIKINKPMEDEDASNKIYVDDKFEEAKEESNKYADEQISKIKASDISTRDEEKNVQEVLDYLDEEIKKKSYFKGIKESIDLFNDYDNYEPGDYCIVSKPGEDDVLYLWDEHDRKWAEKGSYNFEVKSVNFLFPDENGNITVTGNDVEYSKDVTINRKIDEVNSEILRFKGNWELYETYNKNDIVYDLKNLYICLVTHQSDRQPVIDNERWKLFVEGFSGNYEELENKPTDLQDFSNNGDGSEGSKYATESYVQENGGKINTLSINGEQSTIDQNKNVNITLPTVIKLG